MTPLLNKKHKVPKLDKAWILAIGATIVLSIYFVVSLMESHTYNKLTGANTTWWDALWVELRVQDQPRKELP